MFHKILNFYKIIYLNGFLNDSHLIKYYIKDSVNQFIILTTKKMIRNEQDFSFYKISFTPNQLVFFTVENLYSELCERKIQVQNNCHNNFNISFVH